jgi:hypothetical protein
VDVNAESERQRKRRRGDKMTWDERYEELVWMAEGIELVDYSLFFFLSLFVSFSKGGIRSEIWSCQSTRGMLLSLAIVILFLTLSHTFQKGRQTILESWQLGGETTRQTSQSQS